MLEIVKINKIKINPNNPRVIKDERYKQLIKSIQDFPEMLELRPIIIDNKNMILGGNMRLKALLDLDYKEIPILRADKLTDQQKKEFIIKDNLSFGEWDYDLLANEWQLDELLNWGLDFPSLLDDDDSERNVKRKLLELFLIVPFSVLDSRRAEWQDRKRYWLSLGIKSDTSREEMKTSGSPAGSFPHYYDYKEKTEKKIGKQLSHQEFEENYLPAFMEKQSLKLTSSGGILSVFDPVLCELAYRWFNIENGKILDPFAGGSVRGIVASILGYEYLGNDLSEEQIKANRINAAEVLKDKELFPRWTIGDSLNIDKLANDYKADLVFSCPPYADLEIYSNAKEDLSNMDYDKFIITYKEIIKKTCGLLNENRFAVFVVGNVRDKKGFYRNFVSDTINAFLECGLKLYNEMILVNVAGSLPIRIGKQFNTGRKVGKNHQNVLVFYKGDPKQIKQNYKELDLSYIKDNEESL